MRPGWPVQGTGCWHRWTIGLMEQSSNYLVLTSSVHPHLQYSFPPEPSVGLLCVMHSARHLPEKKIHKRKIHTNKRVLSWVNQPSLCHRSPKATFLVMLHFTQIIYIISFYSGPLITIATVWKEHCFNCDKNIFFPLLWNLTSRAQSFATLGSFVSVFMLSCCCWPS